MSAGSCATLSKAEDCAKRDPLEGIGIKSVHPVTLSGDSHSHFNSSFSHSLMYMQDVASVEGASRDPGLLQHHSVTHCQDMSWLVE